MYSVRTVRTVLHMCFMHSICHVSITSYLIGTACVMYMRCICRAYVTRSNRLYCKYLCLNGVMVCIWPCSVKAKWWGPRPTSIYNFHIHTVLSQTCFWGQNVDYAFVLLIALDNFRPNPGQSCFPPGFGLSLPNPACPLKKFQQVILMQTDALNAEASAPQLDCCVGTTQRSLWLCGVFLRIPRGSEDGMYRSTLASPHCDSLKLEVQKRPISDESELCSKMLPWKVHLNDCNSNFWDLRPCWHGPWTYLENGKSTKVTVCSPQAG